VKSQSQIPTLLPLLLALVLLPACHSSNSSGGDDDTDTGTGSDSDTDSDVDTDTDSDTDSDSDSDTDDTDTWPNGDTAPEGFGEVAQACWVKTFGGPDADWTIEVIALPDGSALVLGKFYETITLGLGEPGETTLDDGDAAHHFLARFDTDGALDWVRLLRVDAEVFDIDFVPPDGVFILGNFNDNAIFNIGEPDEAALTGEGDLDICLARYNLDGGVEWARQDGGHEDVWPSGVAALSGGTALVTGTFTEEATFGLDEEHETTLTIVEHPAMFMARYYPDGTLAWARAECTEGERGCSPGPNIAVSESDSVFMVSGWYWDGTVFGYGQPNETVMESNALEWSEWPDAEAGGLFMAVFDYYGTLQWVASAEADWPVINGETKTMAVALSDGSYAVAGTFGRDMVFDYGGAGETFLHAPSDDEDTEYSMYAARVTDSGSLLWALSSESGLWDGSSGGKGSAALPDEHLLVGGFFSGAVNFDSELAEAGWLVSSGEREPFAAIYTDTGELDWLARMGSSWESAYSISVDALEDSNFIVSGSFNGEAQFLVGEDEYVTVTSVDAQDCFLMHACPEL
jgi:hypothetical protein